MLSFVLQSAGPPPANAWPLQPPTAQRSPICQLSVQNQSQPTNHSINQPTNQPQLTKDSIKVSWADNDCCCHVAQQQKTVPLEKVQDVEFSESWLLTCFGLKAVRAVPYRAVLHQAAPPALRRVPRFTVGPVAVAAPAGFSCVVLCCANHYRKLPEVMGELGAGGREGGRRYAGARADRTTPAGR